MLRIVRDARPAAALTTTGVLAASRATLAVRMPSSSASGTGWRSDALPADATESPWASLVTPPDRLAVLQYTSGSTDAPRGVMLTTRTCCTTRARSNALRAFDDEAAGASSGCRRTTTWVWSAASSSGVYAGFPIALMSPIAFLQRPARWLEAISRYRATISGGPNFAYDLCVERITPEQSAQAWTCRPGRWRSMARSRSGRRHSTRFAEAFAASGFRREAFYPCYGLAEATLMVTGGDWAAPPSVTTVATVGGPRSRSSSGPAIDGLEVVDRRP